MCILISSAIFCSQCSSNTSFADCTTNQVVVQCIFPQNRCFKQHNATEENINVRVFHKGCIPADQCRGNNETSMECCADDHCNGGKFTLNYVSLSHYSSQSYDHTNFDLTNTTSFRLYRRRNRRTQLQRFQ